MKISTTILTAARMAAPVFAMNAWEYHDMSGNGHVPDAAEIALLLNQLVDSVLATESPPTQTATAKRQRVAVASPSLASSPPRQQPRIS